MKSLVRLQKVCTLESPPSWWSGLKLNFNFLLGDKYKSPPSWWSGLKSDFRPGSSQGFYVSTLVVEWIEITAANEYAVSVYVSTLVVEWIEIYVATVFLLTFICLHPRGGVD